MALTKYVSAEWVHDELMNTYTIKAIGDDGIEYWIGSPDSDVPPWPDYTGPITGEGPPQDDTT